MISSLSKTAGSGLVPNAASRPLTRGLSANAPGSLVRPKRSNGYALAFQPPHVAGELNQRRVDARPAHAGRAAKGGVKHGHRERGLSARGDGAGVVMEGSSWVAVGAMGAVAADIVKC